MSWEAIRYGCDNGFCEYITLSAAGNRRLHSYYSSKFDSELKIRFLAKKATPLAGMLEHLYTGYVKPFRGKMKHYLNRSQAR